MLKIIKLLMSQKLLVNLVVLLFFVLGYNTLVNMNRESFPEVNFDMVSITTIYHGGSPDEMEQLVSVPIEKKLREVDGLDKVRSYNIENVSVIAIYLEDNIPDKKSIVQDIKDKVESVSTLPEQAERPVKDSMGKMLLFFLYGKRKVPTKSQWQNGSKKKFLILITKLQAVLTA